MKKILILLVCLISVSGCARDEFKSYYQNMKIGDITSSYRLELRLSGIINGEKVNELYEIRNDKNESYMILKDNNTYYVKDNILYKEIKTDGKEIVHEKSMEKLFYETDFIIEGLNNVTSKEVVKDDLTNLELDVYNAKVKSSYIKELLSKLGFKKSYNEALLKIYLKDNQVYKLVYEIDDLTINASFSKINKIRLND